MNRSCLATLAFSVGLIAVADVDTRQMSAPEVKDWRVVPIAQQHVEVYRSPDPRHIQAHSPGLAVAANGRLIATMDLTARAGAPERLREGFSGSKDGRIYLSDDRGGSWRLAKRLPLMFMRPFVAGESLYVIGRIVGPEPKDRGLGILPAEVGLSWYISSAESPLAPHQSRIPLPTS